MLSKINYQWEKVLPRTFLRKAVNSLSKFVQTFKFKNIHSASFFISLTAYTGSNTFVRV